MLVVKARLCLILIEGIYICNSASLDLLMITLLEGLEVYALSHTLMKELGCRYAALGTTRSRYILYKDTSRDPLLHPY
jgi:hypothetical protein